MPILDPTPQAIAQAVSLLRAGEVIGLPTETVYGLAADAQSEAGVGRIFSVKGRPSDHPLIVHVHDAQQAQWWGELDAAGLRLAQAFWPGPLTLIVPRRAGVPAWACGGQDSIGLRCPSHPVAQQLLRALAQAGSHGVAAPSANRFGRVSPTCAEHVAADLGEAVPLILEGGPCEVGVESTIVDLTRGAPVLLRPGGVSAQAIAEALQGLSSAAAASGAAAQAAPRASGTLEAHYAPRTALTLVAPAALAATARRCHQRGERVAVWSVQDLDPGEGIRRLPARSDPAAFAHALYAQLRHFDSLGLDRVLVGRLPDDPAWDAARDRLARAAASFPAPGD